MQRGNVTRRTHQCWWEDLRAWVEQLHGQYGFQTEVVITLPADRHGLHPAVAVRLHKPAVGLQATIEYREWSIFSTEETGAAESAALKLISAMLLRLDNEAERAEREQSSLWGQE